MGLFSKLFGKTEPPEADPPLDLAALPYDLILVPGDEAVETCMQLREEGKGQFTPIMLGDPKDLRILLEGFEMNGEAPEAFIERAKEMTYETFEKERLEDEDETYSQIEVGKWPSQASPANKLTGHTNILTGKPLKMVVICKVPTPHSWEVPAYLAFGGWNENPAPEEHVALLRRWYELYGAELITLSNDVLECTVSRPPTVEETAMALAREQFIYCSDIVYQGTETLALLASGLKNGKTWFFWWD